MLLDFTTMKDDDRALCDRNEPIERERERESSLRIIRRHYSSKKTSAIKKGQADLATAASLLKAT